MVEVSRSGAVRSMIFWRNVQRNTARIARAIDNAAVCRTFMRSISFITTTHGDGFIARISQIAIAHRTCTIGALAGLSYTLTVARSVRSVF
jgi:hypothetical protein